MKNKASLSKNKKKITIAVSAFLVVIGLGIFVWSNLHKNILSGSLPEKNFILLNDSFTERRIADTSSALSAIGDVLGIKNVDYEFSDGTINNIFGNKVYRFEQEYKGIPVYGRCMVVSADESGNSLFLSGNYMGIDGLELEVKTDSESASSIASKHYGEDSKVFNTGLVVYSLDDHLPELSWKIYVESDKTIEDCFISAKSGKILASNCLIYSEQILGSGFDIEGENQSFYTENKVL